MLINLLYLGGGVGIYRYKPHWFIFVWFSPTLVVIQLLINITIMKNRFDSFSLNLILIIINIIILSSSIGFAQGNAEDINYIKTIAIGQQTWMDKNLNIKHFRNGDPIFEAKTKEEWAKAGKNKQPAYCFLKWHPGIILYNWYAVNDPRGLAPLNYRIPTHIDWENLITFLGKDGAYKLRSKSEPWGKWYKVDNGTDEYGFNSRPSNIRFSDGSYSRQISIIKNYYWSSSRDIHKTKYDYYEFPKFFKLSDTLMEVIEYPDVEIGIPVRCLKTSASSHDKIIDIDSNEYNTVFICNNIWMAENLNTSHFKNGDPILEAKTTEEWENAGQNATPAWCYYDFNPNNENIYGKLYNSYAINDSRELAPIGYHMPTNNNWVNLIDCLGGKKVAGYKLKSASGWLNNGSDEYGFSALPAGGTNSSQRTTHGGIGESCHFWSINNKSSFYYNLFDHDEISRLKTGRNCNGCQGFAVRCIKD
jgi:uncharacterized protein (TIGR02145 family)